MTSTSRSAVPVLLVLLAAAAPAVGAETAAAPSDSARIAEQLPWYPLDTCLVTEQKLDALGQRIDFLHEGRLVRLCCAPCAEMFRDDPESYLADLDAAIVAAQGPTYPLETCPVSGKPLGSMGDVYEHVHGTRLVRFCCAGCVKSFEKDAEKHFARLNKAVIEAQRV